MDIYMVFYIKAYYTLQEEKFQLIYNQKDI